MVPIYCLSIVLRSRQLDLVFQSFADIRQLFVQFFVPLKSWLARSGIQIIMPSFGAVLWKKFRFLLLWRLGYARVLQTIPGGWDLPYHKAILLAKKHLLQAPKKPAV